MKMKRFLLAATLMLAVFTLVVGPALAAGPSLDAWKPAFDPSGAKYKLIVSNEIAIAMAIIQTPFAQRELQNQLKQENTEAKPEANTNAPMNLKTDNSAELRD